jgi:hypothetical protein
MSAFHLPSSVPVDAYTLDRASKPPVSPHALDDEFSGASLDAKWSWDNQGSVTAAVANGKLLLTAPVGSGTQSRSIRQVSPTGDFTAVTRMAVGQRPVDYHMATLYVGNNSSGKQLGIGFQTFSGNRIVGVDNWSTNSSYSSRSNQEARTTDYAWLRIRKVGSNLYFEYSLDGVAWVEQWNTTLAAFISSVDRVGLSITNNHASIVTTASFDFFRVTEP